MYDVPLHLAAARSVGDLLRRSLEEREWSTGELWRRVREQVEGGVSRVMVWQWCAGRAPIAVDHLQAVGDVLEWPPGVRVLATELAARDRAERRR